MKKVVLCAVALAFGSFAFGQVSGSTPTASTPVTNLSPSGDANVGQAVQNGDNHKVRVRQAGTMQSVYTEQDNGSTLAGGNQARVRQTGNVNGNQANSGQANRAEARQSGEANQSTTLQEGDFNNAVTLQGQNDASSTGNKSFIHQGVANQAESNYAATEQDGTNNQASTLQTWDKSDAWTRQIGDANKSMIVQNGAPEDSDGHSAMNYQEGERNESSIDQRGAGGRNVAEASQFGADNQAKQKQVTSAVSGEAGNRGMIRQGAAQAGVSLDQSLYSASGAAVQAATGDADAALWFTGDTQGAKAKQTQYGQGNAAEIAQRGGTVGASNYAEQMQAAGSSDNTASIGQGHYFQGDESNYAKQYQEGSNNNASYLSGGSGLMSLQDQRGSGNNALSSQRGKDHLLNIHQRGDDNAAASVQLGTANRALIVQHDGQSFLAQQNLGLSNPWVTGGGNNQIDALQVGPHGNFGSDYSIECDFEAPMNLDMDYNVPNLDLGDICEGC